jgi:3-phenylpropionate/cinnamic acid dioxygenase small subunit
MTATAPARPTQIQQLLLQHQVEQFYYTEARMIDERDHLGWLALFADDVRYLLPIRRNRADGELSNPTAGGTAHFDDGKEVLARRVTRMLSGMAWTDDPPSIQRHLVTNVQVSELENGALDVHSCFQAHRYRMDREVEVFTGARHDVLRRAGDSFLVAARTVLLDHATVLANNLNLFF